MKVRFLFVLVLALLLGGVTIAQEDHKIEVTGDYSYFRFNPGLPSYFNSKNLNGGGGQVTLFITPNIGLAGDLQGYGSSTQCTKPGAIIQGCASGNLFTYMFGPQFKARKGKLEPFGEVVRQIVAPVSKDFFPLDVSTSVLDGGLIRRPAKDARRKWEPCLVRVSRRRV